METFQKPSPPPSLPPAVEALSRLEGEHIDPSRAGPVRRSEVRRRLLRVIVMQWGRGQWGVGWRGGGGLTCCRR